MKNFSLAGATKKHFSVAPPDSSQSLTVLTFTVEHIYIPPSLHLRISLLSCRCSLPSGSCPICTELGTESRPCLALFIRSSSSLRWPTPFSQRSHINCLECASRLSFRYGVG